MWIESESSGAYSCYEEFVEDTVPYLRKEMELMLASVRASEQRVLAQVGLLSPPASMHMLVLRASCVSMILEYTVLVCCASGQSAGRAAD